MKNAGEEGPIRRDWLLAHEDAIARFEQAWRATGFPVIDEFLPPPGSPGRDELRDELVQMDQEFRAARGESAKSGASQQRIVDVATVIRAGATPAGDAASAPDAFQRIGRYEVRDQLGHGAFATVFLAWDPDLRREVAIKVPHRQILQSPLLRERFLREARSVARLSHPAIVPIHEVGHTGQDAYIVYEFMPGGSLAAKLEQIDPAPEQAALWVERLGMALEHAHQHGIIHRDVKPGNVLMNVHGEPMLTDFGLAAHTETDSTLTQEGDLLGTPAYMSPEQAMGKGHVAGPRSDVYSLGVVLYELLTGRRPFESGGVGVLHEVAFDEPATLRSIRSTIPGDLEVICMKAMAKEPNRRYASAAAFAADLRRWIERRPIEARRMSAAGRIALWCRRRPAQAATVAVALAVTLSVVTLSFARVLAERDRYREANVRSERNLYRALTSAARSANIASETGWYWKSLELVRQASALDVENRDTAELRSLALDVLGRETPCFRLLATLPGHQGAARTIAASPDAVSIASGGEDGIVRLWDLESGALTGTFSGHSDVVTGLAFVPDAELLASVSRDGTLRFWNLATQAAMRVENLGAPVLALAVSPDGDKLATGASDGVIRIFSIAGDVAVREFRGGTAAIRDLSWSDDGARLASGADDGAMRVWELESGEVHWVWSSSDPIRSLRFGPGGQTIAVTLSTWFSFTMIREGGPTRDEHSSGHQDSLLDLDWSKEWGVLSASADGTLRLWKGLKECAMAGDVPAAAHAATFVRGSDRVVAAYSDGAVRIWELAIPVATVALVDQWNAVTFVGGTRKLVSQSSSIELSSEHGNEWRAYTPAAVAALAVASRRRELAVGGSDGQIRVIDLKTNRETAKWQAHMNSVKALAVVGVDGMAMASSDGTSSIVIWNWQGEQLIEIETAVGEIHELAAAGEMLFCTGASGFAAWDLSDARTHRWRVEQSGSVHRAMALATRSDHLAVAPAGDGGVAIFDFHSGEQVRALGNTGARVTRLAFSLDESTLITADVERQLRFRDPLTGRDLANAQSVELLASNRGLIPWPGGRVLVVGQYSELWDPQAGLLLGIVSSSDTAIAMDEIGESVLLGTSTGAVRRISHQQVDDELEQRETNSGKSPTRWLTHWETVADGGHLSVVWGVAASPDGRWIASAGHDEVIKLWRAPNFELAQTLDGHGALVWCVGFDARSQLLAAGGSGVGLFDVETGRELKHFEGGERLVVSVAFHPSRPLLASAALDGNVRLFDIEELQEVGALATVEGAAHDVEFSPDGRWLAVAGHDRNIALWRMKEAGASPAPGAAPDRILAGHTGAVWAVAYSPDGKILASGSERGEVILWHGETGARLATVKTTSSRIRALAFSPDGALLAYACYHSQGRVWDLTRFRADLQDLGLDW